MKAEATINPICAVCGDRIGEMTASIYARAINYRGPALLCPECRKHKCDCCGFVYPESEVIPHFNMLEGFIGNACAWCADDIVPPYATREDFPAFFTYDPPNVITLQASEDVRLQLIRAEEGERWEG